MATEKPADKKRLYIEHELGVKEQRYLKASAAYEGLTVREYVTKIIRAALNQPIDKQSNQE